MRCAKKDRRPRCEENYRKMLQLCRKYELPILLSSDAHDPADVKNMRYIMEFMDEADFPRQLVINTLMDFLQTGCL